MSGRGRRGRGRPPRTPSLSTRSSSHFLNPRKPRALGGHAAIPAYSMYSASSEPNSRSSTPVSSTSSTPTTRSSRLGLRSRNRGRGLLHSVYQSLTGHGHVGDELDDNDVGLSDDEACTDVSDTSEELGLDHVDGHGVAAQLDASYHEESGSDWSEESFSTISSTTPRRKFLLLRPQTPEYIDPKDIPPLTLPSSSTDLIITGQSLIRALTIFEVLRHFRIVLRLSPFRFEDFCSALASDEQSTLLCETHISLMRALLREEDGNNTHFTAQDMKDSANICYFFLDSMTWYELARCYLESDKSGDYTSTLKAIEKPDYPSTTIPERLEILHTLADMFLATNIVREEIINEGNIRYDDHCRSCHRLGDLLCCETCSAVYHLGCVDPPMGEVPDEDWVCTVCKAHQVQGVIDCVSEAEKSGLLCRHDPLGVDRHMRKYWFLSRRLVVEGENEVFYYSTPEKLEELLSVLDPDKWEADLVRSLVDSRDEIERQMNITTDITDKLRCNKKSALEVEKAMVQKMLCEREEMEKEKKEVEKTECHNQETEDASEAKDETHGEAMEIESVAEASVTNVTTTSVNSYTTSTQDKGSMTRTKEETLTTTTTTTTSHTTISVVDGKDSRIADVGKEEDMEVTQGKCAASTEVHPPCSTKLQNNTDATAKDEGTSPPKELDFAAFLKDARAKIFNANEDTQTVQPSLKKMMVINKDGTKTLVTVVAKTVEGDTSSGTGDGRHITRSKTGSSTPKQFNDSVSTTSLKTSLTKTMASEEVLTTVTKDGDVARVTRSRVAAAATGVSVNEHSLYYKLGDEATYKSYQNQYSSSQLALNKHQHNEERLKRQHLSHKFSLTPISDFKWNGSCNGSRTLTIQTLRQTVAQLESNLPGPFLHPNWHLHRQNWLKAVQMCSSPQDFAMAIAILEACVKPCLFNPVWHDYMGHTKMLRITAQEREELKKKDNITRKRREEDEEIDRSTWAKYTLGLRHQVWKQKGEEYRIVGQGGWKWISCTRIYRVVPQNTVGLRQVAVKLKMRHKKVSSARQSEKTEGGEDSACITDPASNIAITDANIETGSEKAEKLGEQYEITEDVINVSQGMLKRTRYPKCTKPYSWLDQLLEKRLKQWDVEQKQKLLLTQVMAKYKSLDKNTGEVQSGDKGKDTDEMVELEMDNSNVNEGQLTSYLCYSVLCRQSSVQIPTCYSSRCAKLKETEATAESLDKDSLTSESSLDCLVNGSLDISEKECVEQTVPSDKEGSVPLEQKNMTANDSEAVNKKGTNFSQDNSNSQSRDTSPDLEEVPDADGEKKSGQGGFQNSFLSFISGAKTTDEVKEVSLKEKDDKLSTKLRQSCSEKSSEKSLLEADSDKDAVDKEKLAETDVSSGADKSEKSNTNTSTTQTGKEEATIEKSALSAATLTVQNLVRGGKIQLTPSFMKEIEAKLSSIGRTGQKVSLAKFARSGRAKNKLILKRGSLPPGHKFLTSHSKRNLFLLEKFELRKLARRSGKKEAPGFNYQCKMNNVNWPYPCPRPFFKTSWRYRTQNIQNLAAACLQLRVVWACLRWDDMQQKPPAGGTNTMTTEEDITTKELLKRRDVQPYGLRSEYLVREIVVPLGVSAQPKEKYTPQRSGLRERRRPESPKNKEPSVKERWIPEEELQLWEIKLFGEKLDKQRAANVEKTQQQSAEKLKAQMEEQLKQQRAAAQQKRAAEDQKQQKEPLVLQPKIRLSTASGVTSSGASTVVKVTSIKQDSSPGNLLPGTKVQLQPKPLVQASSATRIQLPSTTIMLRPKNSVSVAQSQHGTSSAATIVSGMKPIAPSPSILKSVQMKTPSSSSQTTPARVIATPSNSVTPAAPATNPPTPAVQNLRIIQGANGQLHVQGLLPGQQIVRLPDGRLQLITNASQIQQKVQTPQKVPVLQTAAPAQPKLVAVQPQVTPPSQPAATVQTRTQPPAKIIHQPSPTQVIPKCYVSLLRRGKS